MTAENTTKIAIVTGASKGIGRAIAIELASDGAYIIVNYMGDREGAEQTLTMVEEAGGTMQDIVKLNVFVSDRDAYVSNLKPLGQVFRAYFGDHYPAMALFEVSAFFRDANMIELEGMAVIR